MTATTPPNRPRLSPSATHDVLIVGGGAAGLGAALTLGRAGRSVLLIDSGEPRNRFASHIHGFLSREGISPLEFLEIGRGEVEHYGVEIVNNTVVSAQVTADGSSCSLSLADGQQVNGRRLIVTTGLTDVLPSIEGLDAIWGRQALHCPYCHGFEVREQRLGVVAVGPMSVHHVQHIRQWSSQMTLFLNNSLEPSTDDLLRLEARNIRVVSGKVERVNLDENGDLESVMVAGSSPVALDALFVVPRFTANDSLLVELGADVDQNEFSTWVKADPRGATSVPGVWAAGNVTDPFAQVMTAASSGVMAAAAINMALVEEDVELAVASMEQ